MNPTFLRVIVYGMLGQYLTSIDNSDDKNEEQYIINQICCSSNNRAPNHLFPDWIYKFLDVILILRCCCCSYCYYL